MGSDYVLYERKPDGSLHWRGFAEGAKETRRKIDSLAAETGHPCFGVNVLTEHVIGANPKR